MSTTGIRAQLFGTKKSADTRKAQRFFAERRVPVHFVDLAEKGASLGELRRFAQKHGVEALIDREGKRFAERGLRAALYGEEKWLALLVDDPLLLRQPLVRIGNYVGVGVDEAAWKEALAKAAG
jgi:arsenate reductase-like glutaredoxin family protein